MSLPLFSYWLCIYIVTYFDFGFWILKCRWIINWHGDGNALAWWWCFFFFLLWITASCVLFSFLICTRTNVFYILMRVKLSANVSRAFSSHFSLLFLISVPLPGWLSSRRFSHRKHSKSNGQPRALVYTLVSVLFHFYFSVIFFYLTFFSVNSI
jgi:hypothetical protein